MLCSTMRKFRPSSLEPADDAGDLLGQKRVDTCDRLVEEDQLRVGHQDLPRAKAASAGRPRGCWHTHPPSPGGSRSPGAPAPARDSRAPAPAPRRPRRISRAMRSPSWSCGASSMFSSTVIRCGQAVAWNVRQKAEPAPPCGLACRPAARRRNGPSPASGRRKPETMLNSVVLPEPFGPIRPDTVRAGRRARRRCSARMPPKRLVTPRTSRERFSGQGVVAFPGSRPFRRGTGSPG